MHERQRYIKAPRKKRHRIRRNRHTVRKAQMHGKLLFTHEFHQIYVFSLNNRVTYLVLHGFSLASIPTFSSTLVSILIIIFTATSHFAHYCFVTVCLATTCDYVLSIHLSNDIRLQFLNIISFLRNHLT